MNWYIAPKKNTYENIFLVDFDQSCVKAYNVHENEIYFAYDVGDGVTIGVVVIFDNEDGLIKYKIIDETSNPEYYNCSLKVLSCLTDEDYFKKEDYYQNMLSWRIKVFKNILHGK